MPHSEQGPSPETWVEKVSDERELTREEREEYASLEHKAEEALEEMLLQQAEEALEENAKEGKTRKGEAKGIPTELLRTLGLSEEERQRMLELSSIMGRTPLSREEAKEWGALQARVEKAGNPSTLSGEEKQRWSELNIIRGGYISRDEARELVALGMKADELGGESELAKEERKRIREIHKLRRDRFKEDHGLTLRKKLLGALMRYW